MEDDVVIRGGQTFGKKLEVGAPVLLAIRIFPEIREALEEPEPRTRVSPCSL